MQGQYSNSSIPDGIDKAHVPLVDLYKSTGFLYYFSVYVNLSKISYLNAVRTERKTYVLKSGCKSTAFPRNSQIFTITFYEKRIFFYFLLIYINRQDKTEEQEKGVERRTVRITWKVWSDYRCIADTPIYIYREGTETLYTSNGVKLYRQITIPYNGKSHIRHSIICLNSVWITFERCLNNVWTVFMYHLQPLSHISSYILHLSACRRIGQNL